MNYRTDWFKEAGVKQFPDTWDGLLRGRRQAEEGRAGRSASSSGTASATTTAGSIRCCGPTAAREVDKDGKTVVIDSAETAKAVDFCRKFYQETMFEDVLGWTDVSNNKAYLRRADLLHQQRRDHPVRRPSSDFPDIAKVTDHALNPQGPKGQLPHLATCSPRDLHPRAGPGGGQGLPALAV